LLKAFKKVIDKEREADKIVQEAKAQAEKIRNGAQKRTETVYRKTYEQIVSKAERRSTELKKQVKESAEREAEIFLRDAKEQMQEIQTQAEKKFGEAVNTVLEEILS
jgi:vacuolar-type H+-ATPase subunit H